jgi:predicted amidohydrolase
MKIAIFQADTKDNQIDENLARYRNMLQDLDADTELLVLPEMFSGGFTMNKDFAETMDGKGVAFMREIAQSKHIAVSGSLFIKEGEDYVNRHFFVTENDMKYYDKAHLFCLSKEPKVIRAGKESMIVEYKGWKIKLITCYDIRFPMWCRNTFADGEFGYDILLCVASWTDLRISHWDILLEARSIENQSYVIGVNRCGLDTDGNNYQGHSIVRDFKGKVLVLADEDAEQICYTTLSKERLSEFRSKFPVAADWD